ncbi:YciI family protein [Roseococcus microcysteis]|uniref:YciI family protein n=1 Tax=Roseococcus microcysteis TaxID=2771361 RepID=UPI00168C089B|nr:YciI family protein [Roseococcus microcysteis]
MQAMLLFAQPPGRMGVAATLAAWTAYMDAMRTAGVMRGGQRLAAPDAATTLRLKDGVRHVQDGPYADSPEQLAGFVVIEVPDMAAAVEWAARCPGAIDGAVEIRPLLPPPA